MNSAPNGLLAQKGKARPAMRRQNQPSNRGFGGGGGLGDAGGLGGFLMGGETEDLGWNDMGDTPAPAESPRAIGLTPFSGAPESLYVEGSGADDPDWDEADSYDEDTNFGTEQPVRPDAHAQWRDSDKAPPNPVGAMHQKLEAATSVPEPVVITKEVIKEVVRTVEVPASPPANIFDRISAAVSRFFAAFSVRADRLVIVRIAPDTAEKLSAAARAEDRNEADIAANAIAAYFADPNNQQAQKP